MSVILPVRLEKDGVVVLRFGMQGGYIERFGRDHLIADLIIDIDLKDSFLRKWGKEPLPEFDTARIVLADDEDGDIVVDGTGFQFLFQIRAMQRSGVPAEHLMKLVTDHYDAVAALDTSAYTEAQMNEWYSAIRVSHLMKRVLLDVAEV